MGGGQWERDSSGSGGESNSPQGEKQTLPSISNLTSGVPPLIPSPGSSGHSPSPSSVKTDTRDSGNWSMTSASNHSSFSSPMNLAAMTQDPNNTTTRGSMLNPDAQRDSHSLNPGYGQGPTSHSHDHSPSAASSHLSNLSTTSLHSTNRPPNVLTSPYGVDNSPSASRRSSFDTRLSALQLNSAQGTPAASQASLVSHLQRERSGGYQQGSPAPSIMENSSHPYTPISPSSGGHGHYPTPSVSSGGSGPRNSFGSWNAGPPPTSHAQDRQGSGTRVAPPIIGSSRYPYPHPNAPSPTKGFPYAFPDPDAAGPTAPNSREGPPAQPLSGPAPQPNGRPYGYQQEHNAAPQHSQTSLYSQASNSTNASSHHTHPAFSQGSFQELHHHSLQRGPSSVGSPAPVTPYSRTPELRISHKLAERKRRKEMKELFDELRDALPAERGGKSSKWEVLTKSIEYLGQVRQHNTNLTQNNQDLTSENQNLSREIERLRSELARSARAGPPANDSNHYNYVNGRGAPGSTGYQSGPNPQDGNQMQGIERSNY